MNTASEDTPFHNFSGNLANYSPIKYTSLTPEMHLEPLNTTSSSSTPSFVHFSNLSKATSITPSPMLLPINLSDVDDEFSFIEDDDSSMGEIPLQLSVSNSALRCCTQNCYFQFTPMESIDIRNTFSKRSKALQIQYLLDLLAISMSAGELEQIKRLNKIVLRGKVLCLNAFTAILGISMKRMRKVMRLYKQGEF